VIRGRVSSRPHGLRITPVTLRQARAFIASCSADLRLAQGHRFSIGVATTGRDSRLVGVVMVGRPADRRFDDGHTAEAALACRRSPRCVCPMLLAAAWRTARAMGYRRLVTHIRADRPGGRVQITEPRATGRRRHRRLRGVRGAAITRRLWQTPVPDLDDAAS